MALLATTFTLASQWPYQWALGGQLLFYSAALVGYAQRGPGRHSMLISVPFAICLLSWATVVGFARFLAHNQPVTWERTITAAHARG